MLRQCFGICRGKAGGAAFEPECVLGGDLLNQCVSSSFALKDSGLPYLGLYGACSTMAEALCLAALLIDGGGFKTPPRSPARTSARRSGSTVSRSNTAGSAHRRGNGLSRVRAA